VRWKLLDGSRDENGVDGDLQHEGGHDADVEVGERRWVTPAALDGGGRGVPK
jgi:hypothetical protein